MRPLKDVSDEELERELQIRKALKHQKEVEKRAEEKRIYNLPENVAARQKAYEEKAYAQALIEAIRDNPGVTEETVGVWKIRGEDPNFDLGGYHSHPNLGRVKGTLEKAIKYAINQPGWGYGGDIELAKEPKVIEL